MATQFSAPPMPAVARILSNYNRAQVEAFVEIAIGLLDTLDPDPDIEPNGDERDCSNAEDDYVGGCNTGECGMPGCPIADPDAAVDDQNCDDLDDDREPEGGVLFPDFLIDQTQDARLQPA